MANVLCYKSRLTIPSPGLAPGDVYNAFYRFDDDPFAPPSAGTTTVTAVAPLDMSDPNGSQITVTGVTVTCESRVGNPQPGVTVSFQIKNVHTFPLHECDIYVSVIEP